MTETIKKLNTIQAQYGINVISVIGKLDTRDYTYWQYRLKMYHNFSKRLFKIKPKCYISETPINSKSLYKFANELYQKDIFVSFKFEKGTSN